MASTTPLLLLLIYLPTNDHLLQLTSVLSKNPNQQSQ